MGGGGLWFPVPAVCAWPRVPAACLGFLPCLGSLCTPFCLSLLGKPGVMNWAAELGGTSLPGHDFPQAWPHWH